MESAPPIVIAVTKTGEPISLKITVRESTTAPGRIKVGLMLPTTEGVRARDPEGHVIKIESFPAEVPDLMPTGNEFRLEMN